MKFNKKLFFASSLSILALAPAAAIISCGGNDSISNPNNSNPNNSNPNNSNPNSGNDFISNPDNANPNATIPSINQQLYDKYKNFLVCPTIINNDYRRSSPIYHWFSNYLTNPQKLSNAANYDQFQEMNSSNINNILNNKDKLLEVLNLSLLYSTGSFICLQGEMGEKGKVIYMINDQNFDYDVNTKTINKMEIVGYFIQTFNNVTIGAISSKCEIYNIQLIPSSISSKAGNVTSCFLGIKMVPAQNKEIMSKLTFYEAGERMSNLTNEEVKKIFGKPNASDSEINAMKNTSKKQIDDILNTWKPILNQEKAVPKAILNNSNPKCFPFNFFIFFDFMLNVNNDPVSYSLNNGVIPIVEIKDPNNLNAPLPAWNVDLSQVRINATKDVNNTLKITITNGEKIISTRKNDILITYSDTTTNKEEFIDTTGIEIQNGTITIPNVTQNLSNFTIYINGFKFTLNSIAPN